MAFIYKDGQIQSVTENVRPYKDHLRDEAKIQFQSAGDALIEHKYGIDINSIILFALIVGVAIFVIIKTKALRLPIILMKKIFQQNTILLIGCILVVARLIYPVVHITNIRGGVEEQVSYFYPFFETKGESKDDLCFRFICKPDTVRTNYQIIAIIVVTGALWYLVRRKDYTKS